MPDAQADRHGPADRRLRRPDPALPRLRPAAGVHVRLLAEAGPADLRRPDIGQGVPPGRRHLAGQLHRGLRPGPVLAVPDELGRDLRAHRRPRASSSTAWARSRWPACSSAGRGVDPRDHPRHPDRAVRDPRAAAAVVGRTSCPTTTVQHRLAGHLRGADHPVHRERLLDLPVLPVLRFHPEGTRRGRQGRRRELVPHLPQDRHAAVRAGRSRPSRS